MRKRITTVGNSAALLLSKDMLRLLGLEAGGEVEVSFSGRTMLVRPLKEAERAERVASAVEKVFERHDRALRRLATIDDDEQGSER